MSYRKPYLLGAALIVLGAAVLRIFFATRTPPAPATPERSRAVVCSGPTSDGRYLVEWRSEPSPVPLNRDFTLLVRVQPRSETEVLGVDLVADARMPEHDHGMLQTPQVTRLPSGEFLVEGMRFHMPGRWVIRLEVRGRHQSAQETSIHVAP